MKDDRLEFQKWHFDYIMEQIKIADIKINFLLVIYTALMGTLNLLLPEMINKFSNRPCPYKIAFIAFCLFFLYCFIKFFIYFVKTITPRINPQEILNDNAYRSPIFWGDLAEIKLEDFKKIDLENFRQDLDTQILINARIAKRKFEYVKKAYCILMPTILFFFMLIIFTKF